MKQKIIYPFSASCLTVAGLWLCFAGGSSINAQLAGIIFLGLGLTVASWLLPQNRLAPFLVAAVLLIMLGVVFHFDLIDDTYITLRYAKNFSQGRGLVFNAGEKVEGYTSLLWTFTLGLAASLGLPLVLTSKILAILFALGNLLVLLKLINIYHPDYPAGYLVVIMGGSLIFSFWSFTGMETSFALLWYLLSIYYVLTLLLSEEIQPGKIMLGGLTLALAALSRPEIYLIVVVNLLVLLFMVSSSIRYKTVAGYLGSFLLIFAPVFFWKYHYYGFPFPNTFYVKVDYSSSTLMKFGLEYLLNALTAHFPLLITLIISFIAAAKTMLSRRYLYLLILGSAQVFTILYTGADHFAGYRYFYNLLPLLTLLGIPAFKWLLGLTDNEAARPKLASLIALSIMALTLVSCFYWKSLGYELTRSDGALLTEKLVRVGKWLQVNADPDASLATPVIGAMPYYSELKTYDMYGLTDTYIAHRKTELGKGLKDHDEYDMAYLLKKQPDYIFISLYRINSLIELINQPAMPGYRELYSQIPFKRYQIVNGSFQGAEFTFLKQIHNLRKFEASSD